MEWFQWWLQSGTMYLERDSRSWTIEVILIISSRNIKYFLEGDDREEQKEFLASELREAQEGHAKARKKVTAARNRLQRKIELMDPSKKGESQRIDATLKDLTKKDLEVRPEKFLYLQYNL